MARVSYRPATVPTSSYSSASARARRARPSLPWVAVIGGVTIGSVTPPNVRGCESALIGKSTLSDGPETGKQSQRRIPSVGPVVLAPPLTPQDFPDTLRSVNFTLDQLRALDAIDRLGTFAAAAKELHRVPSAITYLVQNLEAALGVALFERSKRTARLTPEGRRMLEMARKVLREAGQLEAVAADLAGGWEASLHVAIDGALPSEPLSRCIRALSRPDVPTRLRVDIEYQEGVLERVDQDGANIGLYLGFDREELAEPYETVALPELEFALVHHPDLDAAGAARLVVRDSADRYRRDPKEPHDGTRDVVYLSDFHSKRLALEAGAGVGWIPLHLVSESLSDGRLVLADAEVRSWRYHPLIVWPRERPLRRAGELFVQTLLES